MHIFRDMVQVTGQRSPEVKVAYDEVAYLIKSYNFCLYNFCLINKIVGEILSPDW